MGIKTKRTTFIDDYNKSKAHVQPPNKYSKIDNWCDPTGNGVNRPNGAFMKKERITFSNQIFIDEKNRPKPAPSKYDVLTAYKYSKGKTPGNYLQQSNDKSICYTDEHANTYAINPAPNKYKSIKIDVIKAKSIEWSHTLKTKGVGERLSKVPKDNSPSPTSYKTETAFRITQYEKNSKFFTKNKAKIICHAQQIANSNKYKPGPGTHKEYESAWEKVQHSPRSLKKVRH